MTSSQPNKNQNLGLDLDMASEITSVFEAQSGLVSEHHYTHLTESMPNQSQQSGEIAPPSTGSHPWLHDAATFAPNDSSAAFTSPLHAVPASRDLDQKPCAFSSSYMHSAAPFSYSSHPALSVKTSVTIDPNDTKHVSPMHARFDPSRSSFNADANFYTADEPRSAISLQSTSFYSSSIDDYQSPRKRNSVTLKTESDSEQTPAPKPAPSRRRKSMPVEPDSARTLYLEKNRLAASKCRSKQKKEQEKLVEKARTMERKNRALKDEVEFLKADMRDLMMVVGTHSQCPDNRLKLYVQREADRLALGGASNPFVKEESVDRSSSSPMEKSSSPPK